MKIRLIILSIVALLLTFIPALGQDKEWSRITRYLNGNRYTFKVASGELKNLPSWNPETEDVPMSPRKALEIARTNLSKFVQTSEKWNLELTRMIKNKWIYEVYFDCLSEDCGRSDSDWSFMIYVKMDGSIVEPLIEPWDGKGKVY